MAQLEKALLGGGCFWCLEALYNKVEGVRTVRSGYAGGATPDPSYEQVCSGSSGHAEVVEIRFDLQTISYSSILDWFWQIHDPTQLNRQGADVGTQYRSVIFYYTERQRQVATESIAAHQKTLAKPIVTELVEAPAFYPAEPYHDRYFEKHPGAPYCQMVIAPKLRKIDIR